MQEFLRTVAEHYARQAKECSEGSGLPESLPLSHYLFCFPNRRCGLFFAKYLREAFGGPCFVPSITTINELFGLFSQRQVPDRTSLLFRLYDLYRKFSKRPDKEEFDQFVFWGDMLLSDFDDVDKYLVDADALFRNVKDLKDIDAEFAGFDPEIVKIIQSFWRNYKPVELLDDDEKREAFGQTWSILLDLYHAFREDLASHNLAYEGMLEREVINQLYDPEQVQDDILPLNNIKKVVFVGLTAISKAERKLMFKLKMHSLAEFCWDYADSNLQSNENTRTTSAAYFTTQNLNDFPNAISDEELASGLVPESERKYQLYAIPSAVGQTQMASYLLHQWKEEIKLDPLKTAVVLPDEKLLLPMLYAIPNDMGKFNVTMGYCLKDTPIASFIELLASLHETLREKDSSSASFYYRPVLAVLEHNFVRMLAGAEAKEIVKSITDHNLYQVPVSALQHSEFLNKLFQPVHNAKETIQYLLDVLAYLLNQAQQEIELNAQKTEEPSLFDDDSLPKFTVTDHEFLFHYNRTLEKLSEELNRQTFTFTPRTLFLLIQKLVAGVSVPFSGEPLQGIQVMGVLETRGMDFDNVIILSMNEGIFPAKPVSNTFVPMSLRNAFEMPTQRHRDAVFAYHFYRLISRAHRVSMVYDSRTEGMQTGEESRYVKQLRYLMGHSDLQPITVRNDISITNSQQVQVKKTPEIMEILRQYMAPQGRRHLSASALNDYITCPLRFYLSYVESLREEDEVTEGVDNRHFGDILHHALCHLYEKAEGKRVDADLLRQYIEHPEGEITRQIQRGFQEVMDIQKLEGYNLLVSRILVKYAVETLKHDMKQCPFLYIKGEYETKFIYPVNEGFQVRMKCIYDRLERTMTGEECLRIIDYKTGNSSHGGKLKFKDIPELFSNGARHEAFQVMLYSLMLDYASETDLKKLQLDHIPQRVMPNLYFVRDFQPDSECCTQLTIGPAKDQVQITDFSPYREEMRSELNAQLTEIFDPSVPFTQCEDLRLCTHCKFKSICKR